MSLILHESAHRAGGAHGLKLVSIRREWCAFYAAHGVVSIPKRLSECAIRLPNLWSGRRGSNPQPTAWEAATLPLSYSRPLPPAYSNPKPCMISGDALPPPPHHAFRPLRAGGGSCAPLVVHSRFPADPGRLPFFTRDIARNWLTHGIYGRSIAHAGGPPTIAPTLVRLPGYPGFLALCFAVFGKQNYLAVLYLQVVIDLATCLLIAGFVRQALRTPGRDGGALAGGALPVYGKLRSHASHRNAFHFLRRARSLRICRRARAPALGMDAGPRFRLELCRAVAARWRPAGRRLPSRAHFLWPSLSGLARSLRIALVCGLVSALPFAAWTFRNWHTFHVFQPLAPRSATDPGEPKGSRIPTLDENMDGRLRLHL